MILYLNPCYDSKPGLEMIPKQCQSWRTVFKRERESLCACTIAEIRELDGSKFKLIITEKTHEILFTDEIKIKMMNLALPDWQRDLYQNEMLRMLSLKNGEPETKSHYLYLAEIFYFKSYLIFKDN